MTPEEFDEVFSQYNLIKKERADEQLEFYTQRVLSKRRFAQWSGAAILIISLAIPFVTNFGTSFGTFVTDRLCIDISQHSLQHFFNMIITVMSLSIALISGLDGLHQWRITWREYSKAIIQIKTQIALWEIKVANARELPNRDEVSKALGDATKELISKVEEVASAEMDTFFSARSTVQQPGGSGTNGKGLS